jgi:DNA-binding CsgD family transcriptional regulator
MKTKEDEYFFSKQEIKILREIAKENYTTSQIKENLNIKASLLSHYLKKLQKKRIIKTQQKTIFENASGNSRKNFLFQDSNHSTLLRELLVKYSHIKWENVLSGLGMDVLFQVLTGSENIKESMSRATFWRYSRDFMALGIVVGYGDNLQINDRFVLLRNFLEEYQTYTVKTIVSSVSGKAIILWQKDFECLIRVPKTTQIVQKGFVKTATSRMQDYGIQLISDFDTYFFSKRKTEIRLEDVILHTLLVETGNVRNMTYALILLKKELKQIDKKYMLNRATWYEISLQVNALFEFFRTRGKCAGSGLPTWQEFTEKAREYMVEVEP